MKHLHTFQQAHPYVRVTVQFGQKYTEITLEQVDIENRSITTITYQAPPTGMSDEEWATLFEGFDLMFS